MTRYLISFPNGAMVFPEEDLPAVAEAAHAVMREAQRAGVWVTGGGVKDDTVSVVATDGAVSEQQLRDHIGGFSIVDVGSREEAVAWAARIAAACRCPQEVRELGYDPEV